MSPSCSPWGRPAAGRRWERRHLLGARAACRKVSTTCRTRWTSGPRERGHDDACPRSASDGGGEEEWTGGSAACRQVGAVRQLLAPGIIGFRCREWGSQSSRDKEATASRQPGQFEGVATVGLDPLAGGAGDARGGSHQAGDARRLTGARQAEAGGARLVGDGDGLALGAQPGDELGGMHRSSAAAYLADTRVEHCSRDRPCVHVETDERRLTHAAPPRKCGSATTRCGGNPRQRTWRGAAPLHTV
jgi:hypothetical protein